MIKPLMAALAGTLLSGCLTVPVNSRLQISEEATRIHNTRQQLYLGGTINQKPLRFPASFTANSDRLTLDWEGDAVELIAQLARQRGQNFTWSGVRLPVPVSVHARNITYENLLRQLETQIGWRATLTQRWPELHLYFSLPEQGGRLT